jgi:hypothetical protein
VGHPRLRAPEETAAFARDWVVHGLTLREMAAMYGYRNVNSVTRAARRLGLPPRPGGRSPVRLDGGRWVRRGMTSVWVEDAEAG